MGVQLEMNFREGNEGPDGIIPVNWEELDYSKLFPKQEGAIGISPLSYTNKPT